MMVIRRKCGQSFHIGEDVKITILDVQHGAQVRLGIDAPVAIAVHRQEVYERIQAENRSSSSGDALDWLKGVTA